MPGYELIGDEEKKAVMEVFEKGGALYRYGMHDRRQGIYRVDDFEKALAAKVGAKYALCVCTGTASLKLALVAMGIKPGDEVITQSFTFIATVEAILEMGAVPVITEVDKTLNMDPLDLEKKITKKTKLIIPVHMAGVAAQMDKIQAIAKKHNIPIVEDSAQALGGRYRGQALGTIGSAGIYSLDIGKIITTGEGGVLVTNDEKLYLKAREYSDHGHEQNPKVPRGEDTRSTWGFNYRSTELHGAIGLAQLKKLDFILQAQKNHKSAMKNALKKHKNIEFRHIPDEAGDASDTLIFFMESHEKASELAKRLSKSGVGTKNLPDAIDWHFAGTWTQIFSDFPEYKGKDLEKVWKQSSDLLRRSIAIPIIVDITKEKLDAQISVISEALQKS